jgi:hypothetical protein
LIKRYFHTLRHLRLIQFRYQLWYRIRSKILLIFKQSNIVNKTIVKGNLLVLVEIIDKPVSFTKQQFTFLNKSEQFTDEIDWNFDKYGTLWCYNLNYFDFLLQPRMEYKTGILLIENFIQNANQNSIGVQPYPIALRGINWIKFLIRYWDHDDGGHIKLSQINSSLFAQYQILLSTIEYHLLGNHLLEDGFSLLFGAFYFRDIKLYIKAKEIIESELKEQILDDGGHFELSPMYHQIILDRLLDCINLIQNNEIFDDQKILESLLEEKINLMLVWINKITFSNGKIPLLNDSAPTIAPNTKQINEYASSLNIPPKVSNSRLSSSGYRRYDGENYECIIDIGEIGPSYQPGHAHADTFNFVLNINNNPFLIDVGISTYDDNNTRQFERKTEAHNTVTVSGKNSSDIWSSFRVAKRAKVNIISETKNKVIAQHNGYRDIGVIHQREWKFEEDRIHIIDSLNQIVYEGKAHMWFDSRLIPVKMKDKIIINDIELFFENANHIEIIKTKVPNGFNEYLKSYKIEVTFNHFLNTQIITKQNFK